MKRFLSILLALLAAGAIILVAVFTISPKSATGEPVGYKLGMGIVVSTDDAKNGEASQTVTIATVITDEDGRIVDCVIDCAASKMSLEGGKAAVGGTYLTKNELGADYGMAKYSPIGKEWYEQAEYFADHVNGMDLKKVKALDLTDNGKANDADLLSGCTIGVTDFKEAVIKAMEDTLAVEFTSDATPELTLAAMTDDSGSSDAEDGKDGTASMATTVSAVAAKDAKAIAAIIDIANPTFSFNMNGEITDTQFSGTKRELLDNYGMKQYSGIGREWYEQADAFCRYIAGLDASKIENIEINDRGKATDADLTAGCTIAIGDFVKITAKALSAAE